jgi:hypothetical protein
MEEKRSRKRRETRKRGRKRGKREGKREGREGEEREREFCKYAKAIEISYQPCTNLIKRTFLLH